MEGNDGGGAIFLLLLFLLAGLVGFRLGDKALTDHEVKDGVLIGLSGSRAAN